ncbi:MAG: GIY-YIG nuclease family protein, partial [Candidatus Dadabacteria bacterium]|nr:GIY-YIG nuclease family protein [Candidatus Dadabacteria bacterium]
MSIENREAFLKSLPSDPGIYQMLGKNGEVLYVGKAKNLKKRISNYFQ